VKKALSLFALIVLAVVLCAGCASSYLSTRYPPVSTAPPSPSGYYAYPNAYPYAYSAYGYPQPYAYGPPTWQQAPRPSYTPR